MTKKQFFILGGLFISTFLAALKIKEQSLLGVLAIALICFFVAFFFKKDWIQKIASVLLVGYSLAVSFFFSIIALDWVLPKKKPVLHQVQDYGGWWLIIAFGLSLLFSLFFAWDIRKNANRKMILIYIGGIAICLLPALLKRMMY